MLKRDILERCFAAKMPLSKALCVRIEKKIQMARIKAIHVWGMSLLILVAFRLVSGTLLTEGAVVGGLLYTIVFYHWVVPFLCGKDMQLIRFTDTFKKGSTTQSGTCCSALGCLAISSQWWLSMVGNPHITSACCSPHKKHAAGTATLSLRRPKCERYEMFSFIKKF